MAEKILNTRILMKIDTLENWSTSTLKLKEGELAFATVAASAGLGLEEPVVMVKIGTAEEKTFSELPWAFHAKASDVLSACKSEDSLKAFINGVIADAGIASSSAMEALAGRVTTAEGKITTLEGELNTADTGLKARMTAAEGEIDALQGLVGDKSVATQIQEKIDALKLGETYAAKSLETTVSDHIADTVAHVTTADKTKWNGALQASDIAAGSANGTIAVKGTDVAVTGLGSAAYTESSAYDASGSAAQALTDAKAYAKEYADGLADNYDAKGSAATAESNAKAYAKEYADGLAGNYDAAGSAADALADAKEYTDGEIAEWVGDKPVATQIADLKLAETYAAKVHTHVKADITDFAHTHEMSEVNGLADEFAKYQLSGDYATKAEAQGYADAKDTAIEAAQAAADKAQGEVDALETYVGTFTHATAKSVVEYVDAKTAGIATDAALAELQGKVTAIENDYLVEADKTELQGAIDDLESIVGDGNVSDRINAAVAAEAEIARAAEKANADAIGAIEADYLKAADKKELQDQIDANESAIELLTNGVSADEVDGVNDLIQYVKNHGTEVTGIKADIKANSEAIDAIEADYLKAADKTALQEQITANDGDITALQGAVATKAEQADLEALDGRVEVVEGKVTTLEGEMDDVQAAVEALEGLVSETPVADQISSAITELQNGQLTTMQGEIDAVEGRVDTLEGKAHEHANKTVLDGIEDADITAWDAKVDDVTAAADSGLKATRTGNTVAIEIDESVTWIFDCGDSSNV